MEKNNDIAVVILAAGKGTRMGNGDLPKVLHPLAGEPLIAHLLRAVRASGVTRRPIVVVGYKKEEVIPVCLAAHPGAQCVWQKEQRGTGDAARVGVEAYGRTLPSQIVVMNGDQPLVRPETIAALLRLHARASAPIAMATITVPHFDEWYGAFKSFSRILRDANGELLRTVEAYEAAPQELTVREVNPQLYCFSGAWLATYLRLLHAHDTGEYHLPDLLGIAAAEGSSIATMAVEPEECLGVNTPDDLRAAEALYDSLYARARV